MRKVLRLLVAFSLMILVLPPSLQAQQRTITGTVLSEDEKSPLPGVTIRVKGTRRFTQTDANGKFTVQAQTGETLELTYVGYASKDIRIEAATNELAVSLTKSQTALGEVVVTAYGISRTKKSLGYSTQTVDGDDVAQTRRENFINSLAGRVAGANITNTSGAPGSSSQIVLRGATSIGGNNQPIFIVDGVPYDNQTVNQEALIAGQSVSFANRNSDYGNRAQDINPEDIETITILKGPEATALYGSDGASGAIVITTKKGKTGKVGITYDNSFRIEKLYRFPEIQTEYTIGRNGIYDPNATVNPFSILGTATGAGVSGAFGPKITDGPIYDNTRAFFQTGFTQQHNLTIDGGSDVATYRLSGNFVNQDGIVPNTNFKKFSLKMSGSTKFSVFKLNTSITYTNSTTNKATKGAGGYLLNLLTWPVQNDITRYANPDGTKIPIRNISNFSLEYDNPVWDVNKNPSQDKVDRLNGNINLTADITNWLNFGIISGVDYYTQYGYLATHPLSRFGFASNGFYSQYTQTTKNFSNTFRFLINKRLGSFSNTFTAGFYFEDNNTKFESQKGERFYERDFLSINNTDPLSRDARTTLTKIRKVRFFGNYVVGFKDVVFLSLAGSREGVSTFMSRIVDKDPFFNYGSASLSFSVTDIQAVKEALPWLNLAKARISAANTGKGPYSPYVIDYRFISQISTGGGYAYDVTGNNFDLEPERSTNIEYGVELAAFSNRVRLDVALYSYSSEKQILAARASYGTGYVIKWFNGGEVENKGIEVQLGLKPVKNKVFSWETLFNFDRNVGKVISMPADLPTYYDSDTWVFGNLRSQYFAGARIGNMASNTLRKNNAGQVLISPSTGLPTRDDNFKTVGDRQPDFKLGWINTFTYKNLSLTCNIDFRKGGDVFNATEYFLYLTGYSTRTLNRETPIIIDGVLADGLENTATPTKNTIAITPMYNSDFYASTAAAVEEDFVENVNWVRLRDVTLSYRLPSSLLKNQKIIRSASVFFTGTDLFMITNYTGADPSVNANTSSNRGYGGAGIDYGSISVPRGFNFGLQIQF